MLLNLSNHPATSWQPNQMNDALEKFGSVVDMPFPEIAPELDSLAILQLAKEYLDKILLLAPTAVHIMGEMNFTFQMVRLLKNKGLHCVASTTNRNTEMLAGKKVVVFEFVQFRSY
jgi:hypothetical protein